MYKLDGHSILLSKKPKKLIIFLHGYGDNAENFISITKYFKNNIFEVNYFAPNAPFSVPQYPTGRQWFDPYPNGIHYNEAGPEEKAIMKQECETSIKLLKEYITKLCSLNNLSYQDCFLIGFSQGAMIVFELGNFMKRAFAGCIMISGRILSYQNFDNNLFISTPLMIMHGDSDDIVSPKYFTEACHIAKSEGYNIEEYLIKGEGHTISSKMLQLVENFLNKYV